MLMMNNSLHISTKFCKHPLNLMHRCRIQYRPFVFYRYVNPFSTEPSNYDRILSLTKGHAAIGGGGLALFGSACLYTWPDSLDNVQCKFQDQTSVDWKHFMDDSAYR